MIPLPEMHRLGASCGGGQAETGSTNGDHRMTDPRLANLVRLAQEAAPRFDAKSFFFLRHGETDGNLHRIVQPATQPLNERGLEQARVAASILPGRGIGRIFASTMTRAWQTASIVGEVLALAPTPAEGLREKWFGDWVGGSSAELDWDATPPNGEALHDFVRRTLAALDSHLRAEQGTLIVAHGGTLYVLASALGLDVTPALVANATPLLFVRDGAAWRVESLAQIAAPTTEVPA